MQQKSVDVTQIIDASKFVGLPLMVALMAICIMLSDGFDLFTMGYVGPHLLKDWGITRSELGPVNSAGLIGMAIGSVAFGWAGDRIGRKRAYVACLAFLFAGSMLCYYAKGIWDLTAWRLVTGLGLGGVTPLATVLVSEWTSKKARSVAVACVIVSVPLGGSLAGIVERIVIPQYGWRSMFLIGALIPLALFALFSFILPESPKYLAQHPTEHPRLAKALNRLVGEQRFDGTESFVVQDHKEQSESSTMWLVTIWNKNYWKATTLIWIAFAVNSFVLYLYTNYLPTLLDYAQQSADVASKGLSRFSGGAALGSIGGAVLIGMFGSRWVGTGLAFIGAVASAVIGLVLVGAATDQTKLLVLCLIAGASINGMQAFMYTVSSHSYPTSIRGSAVGMAQTFSRIGAVASPIVASYYFAMKPTPPVSAFFLFVGVCALITTTSFFLIPSHVPAHTKSS